jgi:hypothetical protein
MCGCKFRLQLSKYILQGRTQLQCLSQNTSQVTAGPVPRSTQLLQSCTACTSSLQRLGMSSALRHGACRQSSSHRLPSTALASATLCWRAPAACTPRCRRFCPAALRAGCTAHTPHQAQQSPAEAATCTATQGQDTSRIASDIHQGGCNIACK